MKLTQVLLFAMVLSLASCGGDKAKKQSEQNPVDSKAAEETTSADPMANKGIGPIKSITLGEIDDAMVAKGETTFKAKCTACHKISKKFIGPGLAGVTQRRSPEWIMNMMMNPEEMIANDPIAKQLLAEANGAPMANQNLTEEEARAILEYFRTKN